MIITTTAQLAAWCAAQHAAPRIFLDTEFVSEGRYYAEVGAIQVANSAGDAVLVDPLAVRDLSPLFALLADPAVEKVFHAAGQDLQILYRLTGQAVAPVFDTQVAAALLGYEEQISFFNLIARVTGKRLAKSHGFTDWLRRPLSEGQVEYALDDVRYLVPIYDALTAELQARGRTAWARDEFAQMERPDRYQPTDPYEQYFRIRGVERLGGKALAVLRELTAYREETARAQNMPVGRVARDEVLVELAQRPRKTLQELREIRGMLPPQISQYGAGLLQAVQRGVAAAPITFTRRASLPSDLEPTVDFLILCLRALTQEQGVAPGLVGTRGDLTAVVLRGTEADVPLMRGWRRAAFGEALLATFEGRATVRIIPQSRQVHLEWHDPVEG